MGVQIPFRYLFGFFGQHPIKWKESPCCFAYLIYLPGLGRLDWVCFLFGERCVMKMKMMWFVGWVCFVLYLKRFVRTRTTPHYSKRACPHGPRRRIPWLRLLDQPCSWFVSSTSTYLTHHLHEPTFLTKPLAKPAPPPPSSLSSSTTPPPSTPSQACLQITGPAESL